MSGANGKFGLGGAGFYLQAEYQAGPLAQLVFGAPVKGGPHTAPLAGSHIRIGDHEFVALQQGDEMEPVFIRLVWQDLGHGDVEFSHAHVLDGYAELFAFLARADLEVAQ